jgi:hypothetical protein
MNSHKIGPRRLVTDIEIAETFQFFDSIVLADGWKLAKRIFHTCSTYISFLSPNV